ncbi:baseplate J/gp47 family protein [Caldanaerobacter subterraneus]|uniref:Baseplate J/gp47 family protein n=2 Tax=Caldanaerobacter subterraneus TaxID=911092 RepID=A0A7Y2L7Z7_9THEO|nr:baseplate J/gp47 family protein [Caldanaerobacter subterraneus]NNG67352.1 baseplate J/gp47 family protein [Caldanaerobacter subterraneus]
MQRLLSKVSYDIDKSEGSFIYDALAPVALELAQAYAELDRILQIVFAQTSYGEWLEKRAAEFGIYRKAGTKATGQVKFSGNDGTVIPAGTIVQTESGLQFQTKAEVTIQGGVAVADIEAVEADSQYNVPANTITEMPVQIVGVISVTNEAPTTGGTDDEDDASLLNRLLIKVQTPATSGNVNHYKLWALEIAGVGDVKVFPLWNGAGTVKVVIIDSNKQPASTELVNAVAQHIEENRPIGAQVTVQSAQALAINISATIVRDINYTLEQVTTNVRNKITEYLKSIAFKQSYVSYAQIGSLILDSEGVLDYSNLTINGRTANIVIGDEQVAVLGEVMLSE